METQKFIPISGYDKNFVDPNSRRIRHPFNDKRSGVVYEKILDRMIWKESTIIQRLAETQSEADQFYHFFNNKRVFVEELIQMNCTIKPESIEGKSIFIIGDTSSFHMGNKGQIKDIETIGLLNDGKTPGFHTHVNLAMNEKGDILGLTDILYWTRPKKQKAKKRNRKTTPWNEKESVRWALGASNSSECTKQADQRTFIFDQEGDNFELFEYISRDLQDEFIIRAYQHRKVIWQGQEMLLDQCLEQSKPLGSYEINLSALNHYSSSAGKQIHRTGRKAKIELKAESIILLPPGAHKTREPISLYLLEAKEVDGNVPQGESAVRWRILTTHPVESFESCALIIYYYTQRWIIEQFFRTLKNKGLKIEDTQFGTFEAILKQTTVAMKVACTILQLTYARNRTDCQPTNEVFNEEQQQVLQKVNERLQGKTEKQKNPFPQEKLSWASWIIGRLGGWKGYASQKPPGPITMKRGLEKFYSYIEALKFLNST